MKENIQENPHFIDELLTIGEDNLQDVIINNKYRCYFISEDDKKCFSNLEKDTNSPTVFLTANVIIYEYITTKKHYGELVVSHTILTDGKVQEMVSLGIFDPTKKYKYSSLINVVSCEFVKPIYPIKKFINKLKYKLKYKVKEPIDSLGLTIGDFGSNSEKFAAHFEYGIDGKLYYEVIDYKQIKDGQFIPLDSPLRSDIINYVELNEDTQDDLANKINESLKKYNF